MCLIICSFSININADEVIEETEQIILPLSDIPEVINRNEAIAKGHIARLKNEETDLHSVIFQNDNGTKSLYMFASPIKYVASDGTIKDKSTNVTETITKYSVSDNDVKLSFDKTSGNGVSIDYSNHSISLTPKGSSGIANEFNKI